MVDDLANLGLKWSWDAGSPCRPRGGGENVLYEANRVAGKCSLDARRKSWIGEYGRGLSSGGDGVGIVVSLVGRGEEEIEGIENWSRNRGDPCWDLGSRL